MTSLKFGPYLKVLPISCNICGSHLKLRSFEESWLIIYQMKAKKTRQVDIMMSQSDVNINFHKICGVHVSLETVINNQNDALVFFFN